MKRDWIVLLLLAALATAAASSAEMQMEQADSAAYEWAELSDAASPVSATSAFTLDETEPDFSVELMELRAGFNIDSIIEGRQYDDAEHDAALLEMEMTSALIADASPADFFRFARLNSRMYASEKAAAAAFAAFKQNKKAAAEMNAELGITTESEAVFSATGPMSAMSPSDFKTKVLTAKNPRGRSTGKRVKIRKGKSGNSKSKQDSSSKKSRSVKKSKNSLQPDLDVRSGRTAGFSGGTGGKSGKSAGQSGKTGGKSGKSAGQSGRSAKKSGKSGGKSGKSGGKSGKTGGKGRKKSRTGGGGVVHSSMSDGTNSNIALPGDSSKIPSISIAPSGYTDPKYALKKKLSVESLRELSRAMGGGIGDETFNEVYGVLKRGVSTVSRALQYDKLGRLVMAMPQQDHGCGSCWAIAAQQSMQRYWTQANFPGVLSIQQLLDCARTRDSKGCRGGTPMDAFEFWASHLAASEDDYPTVMKDQTCKKPPFPTSFVGYPSGGWDMLVPECAQGDKDCAGQIKYEIMSLGFIRLANFQPPIAYVDASKWQNYRGGVFPPSMCKSTMEAGNHVVQIVGAGVDNLGIPYWTVDNFWGEQWGEAGRIRLPFGVNACGLFNFAIYATAPPFDQGRPVRGAPRVQGPPVPYTPKPVKLQKVDPSAIGAIGKTTSAAHVYSMPPKP